MEYLPRGLTLAIELDRSSYGIQEAIKGHASNNEGSVSEDGTRFTFGPCMVEKISREIVEKNLPNEGRWLLWLQEMHTPRAFRYMFLDGQQVVYVNDAATVSGNPLLFQIAHASFRSQQGSNWRALFPE